MKTKYNLNRIKSQEQSKRYSRSAGQIKQDEQDLLVETVLNLSDTENALVGALITQVVVRGRFNPPQQTIGRKAGITRGWANVLIKRLADLGIFKKIYRHRHPCTYILNKHLTNPTVIKKLARVLVSLTLLLGGCTPLMLLQSFNNNITQIKKQTDEMPYKNETNNPKKGNLSYLPYKPLLQQHQDSVQSPLPTLRELRLSYYDDVNCPTLADLLQQKGIIPDEI
jgi:hypothetical protein